MPWQRPKVARRNAPLCTTRSSPLSKPHSFALPKREALSTAEQSPSGIGRAAPRLLHFPASHGVKNQWIGETRSHGLPIALFCVGDPVPSSSECFPGAPRDDEFPHPGCAVRSATVAQEPRLHCC